MDDGEKGDMGLHPCNEGIMSYASSGMFVNTLPKVSEAAVDTYFSSSWDPISSLSRSDSLGVSYHRDLANSLYPAEMENEEMSSNSLVQYPAAASSYSELVPKDHCYGSANYSETAAPLGLAGHDMITSTGYSRTTNDSNSRNAFNTLGVEPDVSSDGKKRKRASDLESLHKTKKNAEEGPQMNISQETSEGVKQDASKPKTGRNSDKDMNSKQMGKQAAESSHSGEASKDDYIHIRARRGQATNSHSLAERLRREKISERMRLLQDIVPGCNKITGKAVMLDEIINYVQSLQHQVEFLSMKLATVNPELHLDIERIQSKDFFHGISSALHGVGPGMSSSHPYHLGILQGSFPAIPRFTSSPQVVLDNEFQSLLQMGYNSSSAIDNLGPDGRLR